MRFEKHKLKIVRSPFTPGFFRVVTHALNKTKKHICDSDTESSIGCQEIDTKSDISDDAERSSQTKMMHYPNGDSFLGEMCSETKSREGYGGQ